MGYKSLAQIPARRNRPVSFTLDVMKSTNPPPLDVTVALAKQAWEVLTKTLSPEYLASREVDRELLLPHEAVLFQLYRFSEEVDRAMASLVEGIDDPFLKLSPSHARFVRNVLLPNGATIRRAFLLTDEFGEIFREPADPEKAKSGCATEKALVFVTNLADRQFAEDDIGRSNVDAAYDLISKPWFQPDNWLLNIQSLRPVILEIDSSRIPLRIRVRVAETHKAFVFGAWMATITMCRSLVEFALIDTAPRTGIKALKTGTDSVERYQRLDALISELSNVNPALEPDLRHLQDAGNRILHPRKKQNIISTPKIMRSEALDSIRSATRIVEYLYSPSVSA